MLIKSRPERDHMAGMLDQWSDWVFHENRGELRQLGMRSWLGELVRNSTNDKNTYHEIEPVLDTTSHDEKMNLVDAAVKSLPILQRETILMEYIVRRKDRKETRQRWLSHDGRTYSAHRKMLSNVKDLLWLVISKQLDKE